jgi:hypothetical protein
MAASRFRRWLPRRNAHHFPNHLIYLENKFA